MFPGRVCLRAYKTGGWQRAKNILGNLLARSVIAHQNGAGWPAPSISSYFRMPHLIVLRQVRFTLFADFVGDAAGGLDFGDVDRARRAPILHRTSADRGQPIW